MSDEPPPARSRSAKGTIVRVALTGLAAWYFTRIVKRIDWSQVGQALGDLALIEIAALLAVVAVRQVLNAAPLALFVPGLGLRRAMANDLSANLVATVAPPPGDIVLRIAMFRSWGIGVNEGIGGLTLNTLTYYVARFGAPLLGLLIALAVGRSQPSFVYTALVSGTISLTVVAGLAVSTRGEGPAARLAGAVARQLRRVVSRVDPDEWAGRATVFVATLSDMVRARSLPAGACQLGLVLSESLLLFASLRFAGVPAESAGGVSILIALLISYPLTALPFAGVGVLDATVLSLLSLDEGPWEATAVAGMVIFRTGWVLLPLLIGAVTLLTWSRSTSPADAE